MSASRRQKRTITNVRLDEKKKRASGHRKMLMAISSKGEGKSESKSKGAPKEPKRPGPPAQGWVIQLTSRPDNGRISIPISQEARMVDLVRVFIDLATER
jgi:hypothetical protein